MYTGILRGSQNAQQWSCRKCTYLNAPSLSQCLLCHQSKPVLNLNAFRFSQQESVPDPRDLTTPTPTSRSRYGYDTSMTYDVAEEMPKAPIFTPWPDKKYVHEEDTDLLGYALSINRYAFVLFGSTLSINLTFFVTYSIMLDRVPIFLLIEYVYFDIPNDYVALLLGTVNWMIFISVIYSQLLSKETCISIGAVLRTVITFVVLNIFGVVHSMFLMYPIVTVLHYTYNHPLKARVTYFINNIEPIDPKSDRNDKYLRLIAVNHYLSTLCYKLQTHVLEKKKKRTNNRTIYHELHHKLNNNKDSILRQEIDTAHGFGAEPMYANEIESELKKSWIRYQWPFRLYAVAIHVSMLRLLFFSDGLDLWTDHQGIYCAFFVKLFIECMLCVVITVWCYLDKKVCKIKQNELKTRVYYMLLKSPQFRAITAVVYEELLSEIDRYYEAWKYTLDGPVTRHILTEHVGKDCAGCICEHIFGVYDEKKIMNLDIDEVFWKKIKYKLQ